MVRDLSLPDPQLPCRYKKYLFLDPLPKTHVMLEEEKLFQAPLSKGALPRESSLSSRWGALEAGALGISAILRYGGLSEPQSDPEDHVLVWQLWLTYCPAGPP